MKVTYAGRFWLSYLAAVVLGLVGFVVHAQTVECGDTGAEVTEGNNLGLTYDTYNWPAGNLCGQEEARLVAATGFHFTSCAETSTTFSGNVTDDYGAHVGQRVWSRLPLGCSVASAPTLPSWSALVEPVEVQRWSSWAVWVVLFFVLWVVFG